MILLDTNVVSELMRPKPEARFSDWLLSVEAESFGISTVTLSEIAYGLARLPAGRRKVQLVSASERLLSLFEVLDFSSGMASRSGVFRARREAAGRPIAHADSMIAATAAVLGASLATRNTRDFDGIDIVVINPWLFGSADIA